MAARDQNECLKTISQLRRRLYDMIRSQAADSEALVACLEDVDEIEAYVTGSTPAPPAPRHARDQKKSYAVTTGTGGPSLEERRAGGKQPFLCPKSVYDAFAAVVAKRTEPTAFEDLKKDLDQHLAESVAEYLPRMCIRFWRSRQLIDKTGTKYRGAGRSFKREAKRAWDDLERPTS